MKKSRKSLRRIAAWMLTGLMLIGETGGMNLSVYAAEKTEQPVVLTEETAGAEEDASVLAEPMAETLGFCDPEKASSEEEWTAPEDEAAADEILTDGTAVSKLDVYIDGVQTNVLENPTYTSKKGGYFYKNGTLLLYSLTLGDGTKNKSGIGIDCTGDLKLLVLGECQVKVIENSSALREHYGIRVNGNLTIQNADAEGVASVIPEKYAKLLQGDLEKLIALGGTLKIGCGGNPKGGYGIFCSGDLRLENADVATLSGDERISGKTTAKLTLTSSGPKNTGNADGISCGIQATDVTIEGAEVTAAGNTSAGMSSGVIANGVLTVTSGSLKATSDACGDTRSAAVYGATGISVGSYGSLTAEVSGNDAFEHIAVYSGGDISISGTVSAKASGSTKKNYAIATYKTDGKIELKDTLFSVPANGKVITESSSGKARTTVANQDGSVAEEVQIVPGKEYDLWVYGVRVNDLNKTDVLGDGKITYSPETGILYLDNVTRKLERLTQFAVKSEIDLKLRGKANIVLPPTGGMVRLSGGHDLDLQGDFTITGTSGKVGSETKKSNDAIRLEGAGSTITIDGKDTKLTISGEFYEGAVALFSQGNIIIKNGTIDISGARKGLKAYGDTTDGTTGKIDLQGGHISISVGYPEDGESRTVEVYNHYGAELLMSPGMAVTKPADGADIAPSSANDYYTTFVGKDGKDVKELELTTAPVKEYDLWVYGVRVNDLNKADILGDGKISYSPETGILYLDNVTRKLERLTQFAVKSEIDLKLRGKANIVLPPTGGMVRLSGGHDLDLQGDFTITGTSGKVGSETKKSNDAIRLEGAGSTITIDGEDTKLTIGGEFYEGAVALFSQGNIIIKNGTIDISGARKGLKAYGDTTDGTTGKIDLQGGHISISVGYPEDGESRTVEVYNHYGAELLMSPGMAVTKPADGADIAPSSANDYYTTFVGKDGKDVKELELTSAYKTLDISQTDGVYGTALPDYANAETGDEVVYEGTTVKGEKFGPGADKPALPGDYTVTVTRVKGTEHFRGTASFKILPKEVTGRLTAVNREYKKGVLDVVLSQEAADQEVKGKIEGDDVKLDLSAAKATVATDKAEENKSVTVTGVTLSGADASCYTLKELEPLTVTITPAEWTKTSYIKGDAEVGKAESADLIDYLAPGASFGTVTAKEGADQLDGEASVTGTTLNWKTKSDLAGIGLVLEIPVTKAENYKDYVVTARITSAHTHHCTKVAGTPATCETEGTADHYVCETCRGLFLDANATMPVTEEDLVIAPLGHLWDAGEIAIYPTDTEDGLMVYHCTRSGCCQEKTEVIAKGTPVEETGLSIAIRDDAVTKNGDKLETSYTGFAVKPNVEVKNNGKLLVEGNDYTLRYANNTKLSSAKPATVTVTGKGSFSKKAVLEFSIVQKDIRDADVKVTSLAAAEGATPVPVVVYKGVVLKEKKDYTVEKKDSKLVITGIGNFKESREESIITAESKAIRVTFGRNLNKTYDGHEKVLTSDDIVVKDASGTTLTEDLAYTVSYSDHVNAGTVKVTVAGIGEYTGKVSKTFRILPAKNAQFTVKTDKESYEYTKNGVRPRLTVSTELGGAVRTLVEGRDYKVTFTANKRAGNGKFNLVFKGNYQGAKYGGINTFEITAAKPAAEDVKVIVSDMVFKKAGNYKPKVWVSVKGELLKKADYTVAYDTPRVEAAKDGLKLTVKSNGTKYSFAEITRYYDLKAASSEITDVSKARVILSEKKMEYTGLPVTIADISKVTLKVGAVSITGDDLKNNFTVSYADNTATGQATVILTAKKGTKYCGSSSVTFTITKKPFGK